LLGASFALAARHISWWENRWWLMVSIWSVWAIIISVASVPRFDDAVHGRRIANGCVALWVVWLILCEKESEQHEPQ
jgi:hypothetical protein